ncbi:MAG: alpha/beta hydrolase [Candidatus Tectomicrobia bacterium]|nr:alpha/beta hydrolase [Candidatus Tectomicrobia bacterium]
MPIARINHFDMYYEAAGAGLPCLFVHGGLGGGNGSATFRQYQMPMLSQHAEVIAFDRRAAGQSETPSAGYTFGGFVDDIIALLDHLGHARAVLMATSAGGPQILQCALAYPERVRALVLGSTATQTVRAPAELASLITFLGTDGLTQLQAMFVGQDERSPANPPAGPSSPFANFGGVLQTYLAYHLHGDPIAARLAEIDFPVLILHGTADEEIPFVEAERLQAGLPQALLVPFKDGRHRIMVTHAAPYTQAVTSFLRRVG